MTPVPPVTPVPSGRSAGAARVAYLPVDDVDTSPGRALLAQAGLQVVDLAQVPTAPGPDTSGVEALMVGYQVVDEVVMSCLPAPRVIATHSAGVDMVDLEAARRRGVWVCNVPSVSTEEVASHALAMLLALARRLPTADAAVRAGAWTEAVTPPPRRLSELRLGVLGMGRIGQELTRMATPLFGQLQGHDPLVPPEAWPEGVRSLPLDELLATSDCLSLHLPLTPTTRGLLDARRIAGLRHGAIVVNVSRGELLDQEALLVALAEGRLAGVGLDVFAAEPPAPQDPVRSAVPALLSPHAAFLSTASLRGYARVPAEAVGLLLTGRTPPHVVVRGHAVSPVSWGAGAVSGQRVRRGGADDPSDLTAPG